MTDSKKNPAPAHVDIDELAQEIRRIDGAHSLGAGALAEALAPYIAQQIDMYVAAAREDAQCRTCALMPSRPDILFQSLISCVQSFVARQDAGDGAAAQEWRRQIQLYAQALAGIDHKATQQEPERYFASGPEGHFYAADLALAEILIQRFEHADDWTITDLTGASAVDTALPIPVEAARSIADQYGFDQVMVIARRVGAEQFAHGEHVTTYGRGEHRAVAARLGEFIKHKVMGWPQADDAASDRLDHLLGLLDEVRACFTRDDDLPGDLLQRIDTAVDGHKAG